MFAFAGPAPLAGAQPSDPSSSSCCPPSSPDGTVRVAAAPAASPGVLGTVPALLQGALDLGPLTPRPLDVTMSLPLRDQAGLQSLIAAQNTPGNAQYHHYLTPRSSPSASGRTRPRWRRSPAGRTRRVCRSLGLAEPHPGADPGRE